MNFDYLRRKLHCSKVATIVVDDASNDDVVRVVKSEIDRSELAESEVIERAHKGIVQH